MSHWLYLSVHKHNREFDAKFLLAALAAKRGWTVLLGPTGVLRDWLPDLPQGVYVDVAMTPTRDERFPWIHELGHSIVTFCEEAAAITSKEKYQQMRVSAPAVNNSDMIFAWGDYHRDIILDKVPSASDHVHSTGHPRFDLLRPAVRGIFNKNVAAIRERYGDFILINSNTGGHIIDPNEREQLWQRNLARGFVTAADREKFDQQNTYRYEKFTSLAHVIPQIAQAFPGRQVVLRPHFTETNAQWAQYLPNDLPNLHIIHEGNVVPWLLASKLMLHTGCTTAVEAFYLGVPAIAYTEQANSAFDSLLTLELSQQASTPADLLATIHSVFNQDHKATDAQQAIARHHNAAADGPLASERILALLERFSVTDRPDNAFVRNKLRDGRWFELRAKVRQTIGRAASSNDVILYAKPFLQTLQQATNDFYDIRVRHFGNGVLYLLAHG